MDNPNNKLITREDVVNILNYFQPIGDNGTNLEPKNLEYYQRAFVHESYYQAIQNNIINNNINEENTYISYIPEESNERLEYLGDSILKSTISRYLFDRYGETREGFLTKLKIKIEKCSMLHTFGVTLGFKNHLLISLQVENQSILDMFRGRATVSFYEDSFEAFIGSIMMDFGEHGYIYADRFVRSLIENIVDFSELISVNQNYKDILQRNYQEKMKTVPKYITLTESGPLYRKIFTRITCITESQLDMYPEHIKENIEILNEKLLSDNKVSDPDVYKKILEIRLDNKYVLNLGYGKKIIEAEQDCAKNCLEILEIPSDY
jgi:dsRNA-specific ribonuclease